MRFRRTDSGMAKAKAAIAAWAVKETKPNHTRYDWDSSSWVLDVEYYEVMREVEQTAFELVKYYAPYIPASWRVATKREVIPARYAPNSVRGQELAIEWAFEHPLPDGSLLTGIIDIALVDEETGDVFLVDWKVKSDITHEDSMLLDGQLPLYAAVLREYGASINKVCYFQMRSTLPADPEIGVGGNVLTGRKGYATTWAHWSSHLPMGVDASKYEATMRPKMKDDSYFVRPVFVYVNDTSSAFAMENMQKAVDMIQHGYLPARLLAYECKTCPFWRLCDAKRYGSDVDFVASLVVDKR